MFVEVERHARRLINSIKFFILSTKSKFRKFVYSYVLWKPYQRFWHWDPSLASVHSQVNLKIHFSIQNLNLSFYNEALQRTNAGYENWKRKEHKVGRSFGREEVLLCSSCDASRQDSENGMVQSNERKAMRPSVYKLTSSRNIAVAG